MQGPSQIEWLNLNKYRRYPFIENSDATLIGVVNPLPDDAVLDFKCVQYGGTAADVVLHSVTLIAGSSTFEFRCTGTSPFNQLIYVVPVNAAFPYRVTATNSGGGTKISATVIFGEGAATMTSFPSGLHLLATPLVVEPVLVTYLAKDRINQILSTAGGSTVVMGDIYFKEGHNCKVTIVPESDIVRIAAVKGAGEGVDCSLPVPGELIRCPEALLRINGLKAGSNGEFALVGGEGVTVTPVPSANTIVIKSKTNAETLETCGGD